MKQLWVVVVLVWYICVNENYLFTRAEYQLQSSTIPLNYEDIQISCNRSLLLEIRNVTVPQDNRSCKNHQCLLNERDTNDIKQRCNGANVCKPNVNLTTECLTEQPIAKYEISYDCEVMCDFESDQCPFDEAKDKDDIPKWTRMKANTIGNGTFEDHTIGSGNGFIMYVESNKSKARMKIPIVKYEEWNGDWICINFWYISVGPQMIPLILYKKSNEWIERYSDHASENVWVKVAKSVHITKSTHIIFEANFENRNGALGLDDISISMNSCTDPKITYSQCGYWKADLKMNNCPTLFISRLQIHFTNIDPSAEKQNCTDVRRIVSDVKTDCLQSYRLDYCVFNLSRIVSSSNQTCPVLNKSIYIEYFCKENATHRDNTTEASTWSSLAKTEITYPISENATHRDNTTEASTWSSLAKTEITYPISDTTTYVAKFTQTFSSTPQTDGIVVGVVFSLVALSVFLVIAVVYFRRSRYAEKKANSIVVKENNHSDYTGHQNVAFSPEVSGNTKTNYCEIRTSKHNEQYHDLSDTFSPLINTEKDNEYSEIANVVNSPNSNPNASTNYQHQYITLDSNATGFNRSNPQTNLNNESKNNHDSNETTSLTGGDDYAILDPDDLESKNNTPNVLPLCDNYFVLDPNETGFNRQENTDRVCNYDLATPTVTSEDPYDVSKDETYDTSSNSRHTEKENNIYSHTVDNVYDTAGNQRKNEESDGTYDHFFGQKSEDDYDISKPI